MFDCLKHYHVLAVKDGRVADTALNHHSLTHLLGRPEMLLKSVSYRRVDLSVVRLHLYTQDVYKARSVYVS